MNTTTNRALPRFWMLDGSEGLEILDQAMLEDFLRDNAECFGPETTETIRNLEPGVAFEDGGGASPVWSIRRATAEEIKEGGF